jgi:spermidine/putrescine transport system substrate-binding protein
MFLTGRGEPMREDEPSVAPSEDLFNRSQFIKRVGIAGGALAALSISTRSALGGVASAEVDRRAAAAEGTLNLYTWPNYYAPQNLKAFTRQTGIKINTATLESNDTLFAKLNSPAGASYDIVIPSQYWVGTEAERGLLLKLDKSQIPYRFIDKKLLAKMPPPVNSYAVPKDYGTIGVIWDPAIVGGDIKTWQDYLDAGAKPGVSGKVDLTDVPDETLGIALWAKGKSFNTNDRALLSQAADTMKDFAKNVKAFNEFDVDGLADGSVVMAVVSQGTARLAIQRNRKLKFVIPQPASKLWVDMYAIPKGAQHVDEAYKFMNFMLQPARQLQDVAFIGYPTALPGLANRLPARVPLRELIFIKPSDFARLEAYRVRPALQGFVSNLYTQIKAAAGG